MPTLEDLLTQLSDPYERRAAVEGLGALGDPRAVEPLRTLMDSVIVEAAKFPRNMPGTAIPNTPEARAYFLISRFAAAFAKLGEDGFTALLRMLAHEQPFVRADAAYGLGETRDTRAFDPLVGTLFDADKEVRISAAYALGKLGDPRAAEPLYAALDGADHRVCEAIFLAFNPLDTAGTEQKLQALYHANSTVRGFAVAALSTYDSETALPLLVAALNDSERSICWRAANELCRMGTAGHDALLAALHHPNPLARAAVISALQRTSGEQSVEALLKLVDDPDGVVRAQVVQALRLEGEAFQRRHQQPDTRFVGLFMAALSDTDVEVRREASKALASIPLASSLDSLLRLLSDADPEVRQHAALALGNLPDARAVTALTALLSDAHEIVRMHAARALGQQADPHAVPALIALLNDPFIWTRGAAGDALRRIGTPEALAALEGWSSDTAP